MSGDFFQTLLFQNILSGIPFESADDKQTDLELMHLLIYQKTVFKSTVKPVKDGH